MSQKNAENMTVADLQRNRRLIYAFSFCQAFMLIVPVLVPLFESKGLTLSEIFYLQAIYAAVIVLFEAPSGYMADRFGRRIVMIVGGIANAIAYFWLNFSDSFAGLILFEAAMGLAMSMMSGTDLAMLYDSEKALSESEEAHTSSIAHLSFVRSVAEGTGALLGGVLALWSFDLMVAAQSLTAICCLVLATRLVEPPRTRAGSEPQTSTLAAVWALLIHGEVVLRWVFIAIPLYSLTTIHVVWLVQSYWEERGLSLAIFGVLWFAQCLTVAIASKCGQALERVGGAVLALTVIGLLPVLGHFGMAWLGGWAGIAASFLVFFNRGLYQVILVNALNRRLPGSIRATVNSLSSLTFRFGFILTGPFVGAMAQERGLTATLSVLGTSSLVLFVVVMIPLIRVVIILRRPVPAAASEPASDSGSPV